MISIRKTLSDEIEKIILPQCLGIFTVFGEYQTPELFFIIRSKSRIGNILKKKREQVTSNYAFLMGLLLF